MPLTRRPRRVAEEETYDIEMEGPHHNFVTGGVVVHNSYNEWSGRYSKLEAEFYVPDFVRTQLGKPGAHVYVQLYRVREAWVGVPNRILRAFTTWLPVRALWSLCWHMVPLGIKTAAGLPSSSAICCSKDAISSPCP